MTPETVGPLTRIVDVVNIPPAGKHVHVVATEEECRALAQDFGLPGIQALAGDFTLNSSAKGVHVTGTVKAAITQVCIVSLDTFDSTIEEDVEVDFAEPSGMPAEPPTEMHEYEPPDEIINGQIDFGALTSEFLALGLDPYPRKPGISFEYSDPKDPKDMPFAALDALKGKE